MNTGDVARHNYNTAVMILLFLTSNFLGLAAAARQIISLPDTMVQTEASSGLALFTLLVFVSIFILVLYKYEFLSIVKGWFITAIFLSLLFFTWSFIPLLPAVIIAVLGTVLYRYTGDRLLQNLLLAIAFAGAGSYIGFFLGFYPVLILLVLLAVYDTVAVFYTEHMVSLAEQGVTSDTFMGFSLAKPREEVGEKQREKPGMWKQEVNVLGGGDVVIPLLFAVAVLRAFGPVPAFLSVIGAALGLYALFQLMQRGRAYPAIPVVATGSLTGFLFWIGFTVL